VKSLLVQDAGYLEPEMRTSWDQRRPLKYRLSLVAFGECCANNPVNFGIQNSAGVAIIVRPRAGIRSRGDDAYHGHVNFIVRSQMIQRSTSYPVKMAALVIGQISVLAVLVWMFH
jgi:hypothetical protein